MTYSRVTKPSGIILSTAGCALSTAGCVGRAVVELHVSGWWVNICRLVLLRYEGIPWLG
jgi:hypothetical protein